VESEAAPAPDEADIPEEKAEAEPPAEESVKLRPAAQQPAAVKGAGSSQKTLVIAGAVGLLVIAALAFFVILPMLSGTSAEGGNGAAAGAPATAASTMSATTPESAAKALEPLPTRMMPVNLEVKYHVERDTRNGLVTVTFDGGPGMNGISYTLIRVTTSGGEVTTKSWKPTFFGDSTSVQGTVQDNRVEVITNFYNGDTYRNIDQVFEYQKRN